MDIVIVSYKFHANRFVRLKVVHVFISDLFLGVIFFLDHPVGVTKA